MTLTLTSNLKTFSALITHMMNIWTDKRPDRQPKKQNALST